MPPLGGDWLAELADMAREENEAVEEELAQAERQMRGGMSFEAWEASMRRQEV